MNYLTNFKLWNYVLNILMLSKKSTSCIRLNIKKKVISPTQVVGTTRRHLIIVGTTGRHLIIVGITGRTVVPTTRYSDKTVASTNLSEQRHVFVGTTIRRNNDTSKQRYGPKQTNRAFKIDKETP